MAAFCMAVFFRGLTPARDVRADRRDGRGAATRSTSRAALGRKVVDKHSTGGVGDKTSIAVGPIVAACGVPFGKMSGRGLGHTGGTLDKLEAIPGFRVELSTRGVRRAGAATSGSRSSARPRELVPADKRLYALRDVTATVDNVSLIAASIMSKKIAAGADAIVLDVKVGDGAFMKTLEEARALARDDARARRARRPARSSACSPTWTSRSGARSATRSRSARRSRRSRGEGPADFTELVLSACAHLLALSDLGIDERGGRAARAEAAVADGSALERYERWISAQGGDPSEDALPRAPVVRRGRGARGGLRSTRSARIAVGIAALRARRGAARRRTTRSTTRSASSACASAATRSSAGEPLAEIHARDERRSGRGAQSAVLGGVRARRRSPPRERRLDRRSTC